MHEAEARADLDLLALRGQLPDDDPPDPFAAQQPLFVGYVAASIRAAHRDHPRSAPGHELRHPWADGTTHLLLEPLSNEALMAMVALDLDRATAET